jgi:DNA repair protein RadD
MILRPYQKKSIADIRAEFLRGARCVVLASPTASGKTVTFVWLARRIVENGQRVFIVVHRQELVEQTAEALGAVGLAHGVIAAGYLENLDAPVQVCMVQTLFNRLDRLAGAHFLVIDEAHHALAATWRTIVGAAPNARLLGVTATPERLDGKGLGEVFDALVIGPNVRELIAAGFLSPFVVFAPERLINLKGVRTTAGDYAIGDLARRMNTETVLTDALDEYRKHLQGRTAIAFCTTVEHSRATARFFRAAGIRAEHLDGDTPRAERQSIIARLETGETSIVSNCGLISEGLDIPSVGGVILLRPTKSLAVYLQQIGRALRPAPGKDRAVILDHSGNVFKHGLPDLEHAWSLEGRPKKKRGALVRRCPECGALIPIASRDCPECGADLRPEPIMPATVPAPLVEIDPATAHERWLANGPFRSVIEWAGTNEARLRAVAAARGYKPGWVYWRLKETRNAADSAILSAVWSD